MYSPIFSLLSNNVLVNHFSSEKTRLSYFALSRVCCVNMLCLFLGVFATYVFTRLIYARVFRQFTRVDAYYVIIKTM